LSKTEKPFEPWLISPEQMRVDDSLSFRDLLELYFMRGGARDYLCTMPVPMSSGGTQDVVLPSSYVFPTLARRGCLSVTLGAPAPHVPQWAPDVMSPAFSRLVMRYAEELGMDVEGLSERGATSLHVIRLLYGTMFARSDLPTTAARLQHANVIITAELYCATDETDGFLDVVPGRAPMSLTA
jgi:hypothetical protein